jgi:hypothetical protein
MRRLPLKFKINYLTSFFVNAEKLLSDLIRSTSTIVAVQAGFGASRMSAEWSARSSLGNESKQQFFVFHFKLVETIIILLFITQN